MRREVRMGETSHGGIKLHFTDRGSGPAVLLLHGHTLDRRVWAEVTPHLVARGLRVLEADLRGHGASAMPSSGYHWSHHAGDMAAVLDAAGVERAAVVGFSLGGGVALEIAVTTPERAGSLVLVSPVMPDRPFEPEFMDNLRQVARTARSEGIQAAMAGPWLMSPLFAVSFEDESVRERAAAIVRDFPGADYLATERDRVDRDWSMPSRLSEIEAPTLVVVGEREMPGFAAFAEEAAAGVPGARLVRLPGGGHLLPLESPAELARLIGEHVAENDEW
jgi:3-oxoadipate enol-lactonase